MRQKSATILLDSAVVDDFHDGFNGIVRGIRALEVGRIDRELLQHSLQAFHLLGGS